MHSHPDTVTVPATAAHTATVIFLHGLGQSNLTWQEMIRIAFAPQLPHVEWILPQAPKRPVSMNQGQLRPCWFDLGCLPPDLREYDEATITTSIALVESIILTQVHAGIDSRRIVLWGFSQGAATSIMASLTTLYELGGVVSMSGWIPPRAHQALMQISPRLPVLWCHGNIDDEVPLSYGKAAVAFLHQVIQDSRKLVHLRVYPNLAHSINDAELQDIAEWLKRVLPV
ncbi:hypothetical protein AX16_000619 [Volvariella volvacea WC 439]|nr:hypothetical protein AX16_000619 [Volvariella volvacea WC 439]